MKTHPDRPDTSVTRRALVQGGMVIAGGFAFGAGPFRDTLAQDAHGPGPRIQRTGANTETLVDAAWLAERQGDANLVLVNVLLPDAADARATAERLRAALAAAGPDAPFTLSIGLAETDADSDMDSLYAAADRQMYRAKRAGGDCARG